MIRITIDWDLISPALGVASGILKIQDVDANRLSDLPHTLIECKIKKERGCIGWSSLDGEGIPTLLFKVFEERVKLMAESYFKGMMLQKNPFHWIDESLDKTADEYLLEHGVDRNGTDAHIAVISINKKSNS